MEKDYYFQLCLDLNSEAWSKYGLTILVGSLSSENLFWESECCEEIEPMLWCLCKGRWLTD